MNRARRDACATLVVWLAALGTTGCSRSSSPGAPTENGAKASPGAAFPSDSAGCKQVNVCDLLPLDVVNRALGAHLSSPGNGMTLPSAPDYRGNCRYSDPHQPAVLVSVGCNSKGGNNASNYEATRRSMEGSGLSVKAESGLGDEQAWWGVPAPGSPKEMGYQLIVFFGAGSNLILNFHLGSATDPLAAGKQMAASILSKF
jgi:hypothetical protein